MVTISAKQGIIAFTARHAPQKSEVTENPELSDGAGITEFGNEGVAMNPNKDAFGKHAVTELPTLRSQAPQGKQRLHRNQA